MIALLNRGTQAKPDYVTVKNRFRAEKFQMNLGERDSTATITIGPEAPEIVIGDALKDEDEPGAGIVWIVNKVDTDYVTNTRTISCNHVISLLKNYILFGEQTTATIANSSGATKVTAKKAMVYVLSFQKHFQLDNFAKGYENVSMAYSFNGDSVFDAMETISKTLEDCWWEYDLRSYPWKIHIRDRRNNPVETELRLTRNITSAKVTIDKSSMYTRIFPIGKNDLQLSEKYIVDETAERTFGMICKTQTENSKETEAALREWAKNELKFHHEPAVTVTVSAIELSQATGEPLDHIMLGGICQMPIPGMTNPIKERINKMSWSDKIADPNSITVTMANSRETASQIVASSIKSSSKSSRQAASNVSKGVLDIDLRENKDKKTWTLWREDYKGVWKDVGTFSKAVTSWTVSATGGTIKVTAKPQDQSKEVKVQGGKTTKKGYNFTGPIEWYDDVSKAWKATGANFTVNASEVYNQGWDNASSLSVAAEAKTSATVSTTFKYKYPVTETVSGKLTRHQVTDSLTLSKGATPSSSGYATVRRGQAMIARIQIGDWYTSGWDAAAALSEAAAAKSTSTVTESFTYKYPVNEKIGGVVTRHQVTDTLTLSKGATPSASGYATVRRGQAMIARINIGNWYTAGWDDAADLSEAAAAKTSSTVSDTFTYKYPLKETIGGTVTRHQVTDTLTVNNAATPAASGYVTVTRGQALVARVNVGNWYTAGWDNASSKSEAAEAKTSTTVTDTFTYKYPVTETIGTTVTRHQVTDTLTVNNTATPASSGYVTVTRGQALIARVNVGNWYTAGYEAGLPAGIDVSSPPTNAGVNEPANSTLLTGFGQAYIKSHYSGYGYLQFTVTVHGKQKKYHFAFDNR